MRQTEPRAPRYRVATCGGALCVAAVAASLSLTLGIARDSSSAAAPPDGTPRLNVVVIVSDDERFDANRRMRNVSCSSPARA